MLAATEGVSRVALDLLAILAMAVVVATLFKRLRLETIPGYLIAGAIAGPHALGLIGSTERVDQISSLATILLMFGIGLHMDVGAMQRGMVSILGIGVVSTLGVTIVAWAILLALGVPAPAALVVAIALSMSSTAVFVRVLGARREFRSLHGRVGLGVAIVQDIVAIVAMAALPLIARWAKGASYVPEADPSQLPRAVELLSSAARSIGGVAGLLVLGKYVLPRVLREVTRVGSGELLLVLSGAIALAAAISTAALGFSPEMGAFLAGFMLAATPYRYQLSGQLAPIRDLLMAVFFTAVGLAVDPRLLVEHWGMILLGVIGVMVIKTLVIAASAWAGGMTGPGAILTGVYLGNAGEFTLVILAAAAEKGVLDETTRGNVIVVVIASLVLAPLVVGPGHRLAERFSALRLAPWIRTNALRVSTLATTKDAGAASDASDSAAEGASIEPDAPAHGPVEVAGEAIPSTEHQGHHVIIAGFGPVGRAVADRFDVRGTFYTVVELNPSTVLRQKKVGRRVVYGDITNVEVLESAGIHSADAVILTIPDEDAVLRACQVIRSIAPDVFISARTAFLSQAFRAQQLGADHVVVEEVATAQSMEREVVARLDARDRVKKGEAMPPPVRSEPSVEELENEEWGHA